MDTQFIVKEENCVKYESCADAWQAGVSDHHINVAEIKQEKGKQKSDDVQSCNLQIKSEACDQKDTIKCDTVDNIYIKQESLEHHELDIKAEINNDCANQTMKPPVGKKHLQNRMKIHTKEKPFCCHICDYKSSKKSDLQRHVIIHTGEKPFQCHICDYKSSQRSHLKTHMIIHTGEKPFQCGICDYKSLRKRSLQLHMKIHTGEKPFQCDICNYKCSQKCHLQTHMKVHTGEKPFQCDVCGYKFSRNSHLKMHMIIHTGEKLFQCNICDRKFTKKHDLQSHMKIHTGEKPFQCDLCHYKSSWKRALHRHMKIHIKKEPLQENHELDIKTEINDNGADQSVKVAIGNKPFQCDTCDYKSLWKSVVHRHMKMHIKKEPLGKCM